MSTRLQRKDRLQRKERQQSLKVQKEKDGISYRKTLDTISALIQESAQECQRRGLDDWLSYQPRDTSQPHIPIHQLELLAISYMIMKFSLSEFTSPH